VRRLWRWIGIAGTGVLLLGLGTAASYPLWAAGMVEQRLVEGLTRRFNAPVSVGSLELDYDRVEILNVEIGEEAAQLRLDNVVVSLDARALWSARADVTRVEIAGGRLNGERAALEDLFGRLNESRGEGGGEGSWLRRRVQATPDQLTLEGLQIDVREPSTGESENAVQATLTLTAQPRDKTAAITLGDLVLSHESGRTLKARTVKVPIEPSEDGPISFPLPVELEGVATSITPRIAVAEVAGRVELADASVSSVAMELTGGFSDESGETSEPKLFSVSGEVQRDLSAGALTIDIEKFELGRVPQVLAALPVVESQDAAVGGHVEVEFGDGVAQAEGQVFLSGFNVSHDLLAREVVRDVGLELDFAVELDPKGRRLTVEQATLARAGVALSVEGEFIHPTEVEARRYRARLRVPPVPCQTVLAAIPVEVVPSLQGFEMDGDFDLDITVDIDYADLESLALDGKVGLWNCKVKRAPERVSAGRLMGGFTHRVTMRDGSRRSVQLYSGSGSYTPLDDISPNMVSAVLTTEDGGFWRHRGFLPSQFEEAMRRNLRAGEVRIGASTITMQMAKNVFLTHERTLSRKLQEVFLTYYVERALSKRRIMEIYLNVIEFGPGIYGVTNAADHYFGKKPRDLSSLEAAYLALMLPTPVRRHVYYCKNELTPRMQTKLRRIHGLMYTRGRIDETEYLLWKDAQLVFDPGDRGDESRCLAQIDRLMGATRGQKALTGLLADTAAGADEDFFDPDEPIALPSVNDEPGQDEGDPSNPDIDAVPQMDRDAEELPI
jgi:hypothetical protein